MKIIPLVLCGAIVCPYLAGQARHSSQSKTIQGSGCIEKAAENSCRVVIDSQTGELYNLLFSASTPKAGTAIKFSGTVHKGATTCMQGKPVNVSKWKKEKGIKCPPQAIVASNH